MGILKGGQLGEILLDSTSLSRDKLEEALLIQKGKGGRIGEILVRLRHVSEKEMLQALSVQLEIPFLSEIDPLSIEPSLLQKVPIYFAKKNHFLPVSKNGGKVVVACADPFQLAPFDDLKQLLDAELVMTLAPVRSIISCINQVYERAEDAQVADDLGDEGITENLEERIDLIDAADEAPIIKMVNSLLFRAVRENASDLHFEPYERELVVRYRIDGILYNILTLPKKFNSSVISRIKIMADMNIAEKRLPQDGRIGLKIAGRDVDVRVSVVPTSLGERVVMRLLDKSNILISLENIGMSAKQLDTVRRLNTMSHGIVLVTGPTGSGKTTTIYSTLSMINSSEKNIITIEDPVEYLLKGVGQIQINPKINLTFANGLRSILRQDPDVIMVGEIRDSETADISIHASLTGHLVFSTLHTNDSAGAITRLIDMGVEPFLISSSLMAVIAQRLVRKICPVCRVEYAPSRLEMERIHPKLLQQGRKLYKGLGCEECNQLGYRGRVGIFEMLIVDDAIRETILARSDSATIKKQAVKNGMATLREDGADKVLAGITTTEETMRVTRED